MENTKTPMKDKETKEFGKEWQDEQREKMVRIQFPKTIQRIEQEAERRGAINILKKVRDSADELYDEDRDWHEVLYGVLEAELKLLEEGSGKQDAISNIEKKDWKQRLGSYDSWAMNESMFITIDGETIYTLDELKDFISQELDKAREEGIEEVYKKFCEWEMPRYLSKEQKEMFDDLLSEISNLKDNK